MAPTNHSIPTSLVQTAISAQNKTKSDHDKGAVPQFDGSKFSWRGFPSILHKWKLLVLFLNSGGPPGDGHNYYVVISSDGAGCSLHSGQERTQPQIQERRGLEEYTVRRSLCHLNISRAAYSTIPQLCGISSFGPVVDLSCRGRQYSVKFQQPLVLINKTLVKSQAVGLSEHERLHIFYRRSIGRVDLSRRIN